MFRPQAFIAGLAIIVSINMTTAEEPIEKARKSAEIAGYSLSKVHRWLHEVALEKIDDQTGLYIADGKWNYRDTAADCYPFLTWAAFCVDRNVLDGPVRDILEAEQKWCNHVGRIPVPFDYKNKKKQEPGYDEMIFQASEYVKDGLIPIIEITGKDAWFRRMKGIEDDIWKHARYDTPYGKIPSKNIEVNGEQIQALVRLYTMTGEEKYIEWAERLADYYLMPDKFVPNRLRDHGCEIIGGLGLLLAVESQRGREKADVYRPHVRYMLDTILERGINSDGIMYNTLGNPDSGLSDCWGYNYVTYLCYDMVVGKPVYRDRVAATLGNLLKPLYRDYRWEGSIDGDADSIEGAIYLLNRVSVPEGFQWVEREMANNVVFSGEPLETGSLWGTMKLQSNAVRTTLMHALMHTQGIIADPWQRGLKLGAAETEDGVAIVLVSERDWNGKLIFDHPRHRDDLGFQRDWPRMNTMPEWFTVEKNRRYAVDGFSSEKKKVFTAMQMKQGIPLQLEENETLKLHIHRLSQQ